jgi:hypothetical protein
MNGVANMPFFDGDSNNGILGALSYNLDYESLQYLKYPIQTAYVHWLGTDYNFNATSEFDSRGRLIKFQGFYTDLVLAKNNIYKIKYYK